ncbi:MAG: transposase [Bryobacteraceae bacterium]|nr:transposase [Bryobacteraceae bacterium]
MRKRHYTLRDKDVQEQAANLLQKHLRLKDHSPRTTVRVMFHVLFFAAAMKTSIYAACQRLVGAPCDDTMRKALLATLPQFAELQRRINRALAALLPKALKNPKKRQRLRLAIDLTLIPYHGKPQADPEEIYRSKAKDGTSHFHAYASAYLVLAGERFTVALTAVQKSEKMEVVVQRLLGLARKVGIRPRLLLLDRGFYSVGVIRYLQAARVPFLMPAIGRGRRPSPDRPATGIRAFQQWKKGGWGTHTLRDAKRRRATVRIGVYCGNYRGQWKRHGRFTWVYAFWGFQPGSVRWLADTYRLRFGIETSYRQMNEARIKTCSRSPLLRLLFVALALLLRNVWVWLHWQVLSSPRRGRRLIRLERLRFKTLLFWLLQVAVATLGALSEQPTERPIQQGGYHHGRPPGDVGKY